MAVFGGERRDKWEASLSSITVNSGNWKFFKQHEVEQCSLGPSESRIVDSQTDSLSPGCQKSTRANHSLHTVIGLISVDSQKLVFFLLRAGHTSKPFGIRFSVSLQGYMNWSKINYPWKLLTRSFQTLSSTYAFEIVPWVNSAGKFFLTSILDLVV